MPAEEGKERAGCPERLRLPAAILKTAVLESQGILESRSAHVHQARGAGAAWKARVPPSVADVPLCSSLSLQGGVKVLITGPWQEASNNYSCLFDQISVPASLIQPGVLRCYCPGEKTGPRPGVGAPGALHGGSAWEPPGTSGVVTLSLGMLCWDGGSQTN